MSFCSILFCSVKFSSFYDGSDSEGQGRLVCLVYFIEQCNMGKSKIRVVLHIRKQACGYQVYLFLYFLYISLFNFMYQEQ